MGFGHVLLTYIKDIRRGPGFRLAMLLHTRGSAATNLRAADGYYYSLADFNSQPSRTKAIPMIQVIYLTLLF